MLAAYFTGNETMELKDVAVPECPEDGLLIKVNACSICGTDLKTLKNQDVKIENGQQRHMRLPRIIGHEISGVIASVGRSVAGYKVDERVVVAPAIPCRKCYYCGKGHYEMCDHIKVVGYDYDGGYAEYIKVEREMIDGGCIIKVPSDVSLDEATLAEPLSCVVNCFALSPVKPGDEVVIIGAGPLGVLAVELAKAKGAEKVFLLDKSPEQLEIAKISQADRLLVNDGENAEKEIFLATNNRGADVIITACPAPAAQVQALRIVAKRGTINFFGGLPRNNSLVQLDTNLIHYKECNIVGTHGSTPAQNQEALEMMRTTIDVKKLISKVYSLQNINEAFKTYFSHQRFKVLVKP